MYWKLSQEVVIDWQCLKKSKIAATCSDWKNLYRKAKNDVESLGLWKVVLIEGTCSVL